MNSAKKIILIGVLLGKSVAFGMEDKCNPDGTHIISALDSAFAFADFLEPDNQSLKAQELDFPINDDLQQGVKRKRWSDKEEEVKKLQDSGKSKYVALAFAQPQCLSGEDLVVDSHKKAGTTRALPQRQEGLLGYNIEQAEKKYKKDLEEALRKSLDEEVYDLTIQKALHESLVGADPNLEIAKLESLSENVQKKVVEETLKLVQDTDLREALKRELSLFLQREFGGKKVEKENEMEEEEGSECPVVNSVLEAIRGVNNMLNEVQDSYERSERAKMCIAYEVDLKVKPAVLFYLKQSGAYRGDEGEDYELLDCENSDISDDFSEDSDFKED